MICYPVQCRYSTWLKAFVGSRLFSLDWRLEQGVAPVWCQPLQEPNLPLPRQTHYDVIVIQACVSHLACPPLLSPLPLALPLLLLPGLSRLPLLSCGMQAYVSRLASLLQASNGNEESQAGKQVEVTALPSPTAVLLGC